MAEGKSLNDLVADLKTMRDELHLKLHLAGADAKDLWEDLETKWRGLDEKLHAAKIEAGETAEDVGAGLDMIADEIKSGYDRIRKLLR